MIRVVVSNQKGGVGKTTTAVNYAGYLASRKKKTLLIDADSQGSMAAFFSVKPTRFLSHFIVRKEVLRECVTPASEYLDVLFSNRETQQAEASLLGQTAREMALKYMLEPEIRPYDAVIIDVAPSITLLQTCAMVFTRNVVIPVAMDLLGVQGAKTSVETAKLLNEIYQLNIQIVGFLPTMVNARLQITAAVSTTLENMAASTKVPILPTIRVDQTVHKAARAKQFLFDYDPKCRAAEDYEAAFEAITRLITDHHGQAA